jgi:hypothetical protein
MTAMPTGRKQGVGSKREINIASCLESEDSHLPSLWALPSYSSHCGDVQKQRNSLRRSIQCSRSSHIPLNHIPAYREKEAGPSARVSQSLTAEVSPESSSLVGLRLPTR